MTNLKQTKKALLTSVMALFLCFTMLLGTTYAWFTDSVSSANNIIQSGNLDVELYYQVEGQSDWTKVGTNTNVFMENALWEPGHTEVVKLKVVNEGTLALKYQLGVNIAGEIGSVNRNGKEFKLSDYIKYGIVSGALAGTRDQAIAAVDATATALKNAWNSKTTTLLPKTESNSDNEDIVTMVVYMPTSVGNEANYAKGAAVPSVNLGINLFATQVDSESDSFDNEYDADAWHPDFVVTNANDLQVALNNVQDGDVIKFASNVSFDATSVGYNDGTYVDGIRYTGDKSFTIDFNGYVVTDDGSVNDYLIYLNNKGEKANEITFKNGTLVSKNGCWSTVCVNSSAATQETVLNLENMAIINSNDASYSGNLAVRARNGATINVNNGTVITSDGASYGIAASTDGSVVNINSGATVIQKNSGTSGGNSTFAAVGGKGVMNINDGATITSDKYGVHTMTTGTPVVNVKGGTINAAVALKASTNDGAGQLATIYVTGGTINGQLETYTTKARIIVSGGVFNADPASYVADGYKAALSGGKYYIVSENIDAVISTPDELVNAFANLTAGDVLFLAADIDMTGKTLAPVMRNKSFTMLGNGHTISNLTSTAQALFVHHSGSSAYTFDSVVLENCSVNSTTNYGALFVGNGDTSDAITITNCVVKNCAVVSAKYAAAFVGYTAGWNVQNDGPVYSDVLVENCSVIGGSITGGGSTAAAIGHAGGNVDTTTTVNNLKVEGVAINGEDTAHTGIAVGTANVGKTVINNVTYANVTGNYNTLYGRFVPNAVGTLTIDGATVLANASNAGLQDAIASGNTEVYLPAGTYSLPSNVAGKTVAISGTKDTVIKTGNGGGSYVGLGGANVTFNGVTIQGQPSGQYNGYAHAGTMTYENCTFEGTITIYSNSTFTNCTFNLPQGCYVWTAWGADEVTYEGCTFNTVGKALLVYHENGTCTVNVNNCVFKASAGDTAGAIKNQNCAAIEIDNSGKGVGTNTACNFTLNTSGNTYSENFSGEWRIKTIDTTGSVTVNGVVYTTLAIDGHTMTIDANKNVTVQ